jgi:RimJ/RimL family protein N-acetyltransferase
MDADEVIARIAGQWSRKTLDEEGDALVLGVELTATGELIGDVMVRWVSAPNSCGEIGFVFHPAHGGRGYATEAAHAALHIAFESFGWHRVIARIEARNFASARLVARLGMRQEAHLVQNVWFKGEWSDELEFALLEVEWREQRLLGCPRCLNEDGQPFDTPTSPVTAR